MKGVARVGILFFLLAGMVIMIGGCTSYYKVTDPHSGNVYYTTEIEEPKSGGGAVKLLDERSGNLVTIQNSEIKEISEDEYNVGVYPPPNDGDKKE